MRDNIIYMVEYTDGGIILYTWWNIDMERYIHGRI